ncbi:hypothetical protein U1Q18_038277 [Sarracenia purpurea var. burkii]
MQQSTMTGPSSKEHKQSKKRQHPTTTHAPNKTCCQKALTNYQNSSCDYAKPKNIDSITKQLFQPRFAKPKINNQRNKCHPKKIRQTLFIMMEVEPWRSLQINFTSP